MEQRRLAKKQKKSENRKKQLKKVSAVHIKSSNIKRDFLHKITTSLTKNHGKIYIEDLKVKKMTKSKKGSLTNPGIGVKLKSQLNRNILEQSWYKFREFLKYKSEWYGSEVKLVNPMNTSITCAECGFKSKNNRKTRSRFNCKECNHLENADINAARNILAVGQTVLSKSHVACGVANS